MKRLTRACADLEESLALIRGPSPSRNRACAKADSIFRIQVQMEARLLWEQETAFICGSLCDGRFDSEVSDLDGNNRVVEGWLPKHG